MEREQRKLTKRLAELDRLFSALYEDKVMERITERNFALMSSKYEEEQAAIDTRLAELREALQDTAGKTQNVASFISLIRNYKGITKLTPAIVNALIDKITVSERKEGENGNITQEICIFYKFVGLLDELHIIPLKRQATFPKKVCAVCGKKFRPGSAAAKYCPECVKKVHRQQSNESKRKSRTEGRKRAA
jgi:predicted RNA-binding Zn-ribbon protein involved in translation (DUF1610 family)